MSRNEPLFALSCATCDTCDTLPHEDRDKKTISDWTSLKGVWRERVPKNGTLAVIGQFGERNVVRMSAAVLLGERCVTSKKPSFKT